MFRKTLKFSALALLLILTLLVMMLLSLPFWLGGALRAFLPEGASFGEYERDGYSRFVLKDLSYHAEGIDAEVGSLGAPTPLVFGWRYVFGGENAVSVDNYAVTITETEKAEPEEAPSENGVPEYLDLVETIVGYAEGVTIPFTATNGTIQAGGQTIRLPEISINAIDAIITGQLSAKLVDQPYAVTASFKLDEASVFLEVAESSRQAELSLMAQRRLEGADAKGNLSAPEGNLSFRASWMPRELIPSAAQVDFTAKVPEDITGDLEGYIQPEVTGRANWDGEAYELTAQTRATSADEDLPAFDLNLDARGDFSEISIRTMRARGEWFRLELNQPLNVELQTGRISEAAQVDMDVDLDKQDFLPLKQGRVTGKLAVRPSENEYPEAEGSLEVSELLYEDYRLQGLRAEALFSWPNLTLSEFTAQLPEGSRIEADARLDLEADEIGSLQATIRPESADVQAFAPEAPSFADAEITLEATGPFDQPKHQGKATVNALTIEGKTVNSAKLKWEGEHLDLRKFTLEAQAPNLTLNLAGAANAGGETKQVSLNEMTVALSGYEPVRLREPATLRYGPGQKILLSPMELAAENNGPSLRVSAEIEGRAKGKVDFQLEALDFAWFKDVPKVNLYPYEGEVSRLNFAGSWDKGPLTYSLETTLGTTVPDPLPLELNARFRGDGEGLRIEQINLAHKDATLLQIAGSLPVIIKPAAKQAVAVDESGKASLQSSAALSPEVEAWIRDRTGIAVNGFIFAFDLQGSPASPTGDLRLRVAEIDPTPEMFRLLKISGDRVDAPPVLDLTLNADFRPDAIAIRDGSLTVASFQPSFEGRLPMGSAAWKALLQGQTPELSQATAQLRIPEWSMSNIEEFLPQMVRPAGTVSLQAELKPGLKPSAQVTVKGLETLPKPPLPSAEKIGGTFRLDDRLLSFDSVGGELGGEPFALTGTVDLAEPKNPKMDLAIKGTRLPAVRSASMLIRMSPDVTIKTEGGTTTIAGDVKLVDSFFTLELTSLALGGGGGGGADQSASSRPPYFSVETPPVNAWRLDLDVKGDDFLQIRTPVFSAISSADFEASGTLQDPQVIGEARLARGVIEFPFAAFKIESGRAFISKSDPSTIKLRMRALTRVYGYDLTISAEGTANEPVLTFQSTPSLPQDQILAMITSGEIPQSANQRSTGSRLSSLGFFLGNSLLTDLGLSDPLDQKIEIYSGQEISETGADTLEIIYNLSDRWALIGEYDQFDEYNFNIRWKVYRK